MAKRNEDQATETLAEREPFQTADVDPEVGDAFAARAGEPEPEHPRADHAPHTAGGVTTRDDASDLGVPMLAG
ncbi:MAG: hypothetical protein M3Q10_19030, partial [Chloroflexota bacterium]|nr:hypothetical protein [Chloroflexota bacterium]